MEKVTEKELKKMVGKFKWVGFFMSEGKGYRVHQELDDKPKGFGIVCWVYRNPDPEKKEQLFLGFPVSHVLDEETTLAMVQITQEDLDDFKSFERSISPSWCRYIASINLKTKEVRVTYINWLHPTSMASLMLDKIPRLSVDRYVDGSHVPLIRKKSPEELEDQD